MSARTLVYWTVHGMVPLPDPAAAWPGWQLRFDEDRYENQVAGCDGALLMPGPSPEEVVAEMADSVSRLYLAPRERDFIRAALRA